jgi:uncharacterized protein involved in outer membrane biogenesis
MKWIKRIIVIVVLLIIVAICITYFSLNSIIRDVVQRQATASLGVDTTLGSASLALFGGKVDLENLDVSSPPKFSAPHIFTLGAIAVAVHYGQLTSTPIHIEQITIDNPDLVVQQANIQLNLQALLQQMPQTPKTSSGAETQPIKLVIDELDLNNANVTFMPGIPGLTQSIQVPIASLTLKDIGNAGGNQSGAAIKDVVLQVSTALAGKAVADSKLSPPVKLALSQELAAVSTQLGGGFDSQFKNFVGNAGQEVSPKLQNTINNFLGGNKKSQ